MLQGLEGYIRVGDTTFGMERNDYASRPILNVNNKANVVEQLTIHARYKRSV
jgi:hypothetical protein